MQNLWYRIESWLATNASEILSDLLPGATDEEIDTAEKHMGIKFHEDFKTSYHIHNGQSGGAAPLMGEWQLLSIDDMTGQWNIMKKLFDAGKFTNAKAKSIGPVQAEWWSIKWIPIAYNGAGDLQCLDLMPAPGGEVGQIISFWHMSENRQKLASSFRKWLQEFADDLENGKYKIEEGILVKVN